MNTPHLLHDGYTLNKKKTTAKKLIIIAEGGGCIFLRFQN